jgi:Binding-prot-dependent transport system membrane comp, N-term
MWGYIVRRLLLGLPTLLGVTVIVFSLMHLAPGDPISGMLPPDAPQEVVQMVRQQLGFDKPLPVQYWRWLTRVVQGDLGRSITTRRPVSEDIRSALGNTSGDVPSYQVRPREGGRTAECPRRPRCHPIAWRCGRTGAGGRGTTSAHSSVLCIGHSSSGYGGLTRLSKNPKECSIALFACLIETEKSCIGAKYFISL